jgi:2-oxo-4-hydroxy-4-carboxy--5-ureidoimidazoline (OHCU) decarboxylase
MAEDKSKMVDIDTSGDEVEIVLDEQETKDHGEVKEQISVQEVEEESAEEKQQSDGLDDYSESVKKRIANLTKKYREAERQREEALKYAEGLRKQYEDSQI